MSPGSPEQIIEERIDRLVTELDEIGILAAEGKISTQAAGQILLRAQLIASVLQIPQPGQLRMVVNRG